MPVATVPAQTVAGVAVERVMGNRGHPLRIEYVLTRDCFCSIVSFVIARKLRVQYAGTIYPVTVRGVERRMIFEDDKARDKDQQSGF